MTTEAARKAWETRKRNIALAAQGLAPEPKPEKPPSSGLTPGKLAWQTRMANLAKAAGQIALGKEQRQDDARHRTEVRKRLTVERVSALVTPAAELSAGYKAAATRKAVEAARESTRGVVAPSRFAPGQTVALWLQEDDIRSGPTLCGDRLFIVKEIGDRLVTLFYPPLVAELVVYRAAFDSARAHDVLSAKVRARVDRAVLAYDRCGLEYNPRTIKDVSALVEAYLSQGGAVKVIPPGVRALPAMDINVSDVAKMVMA